MSMGGVNPLEWILPPLAMSHIIVDTVSKVATGKNAVQMPGSPDAKARTRQAEHSKQVNAAQTLAESRQREDEAGVATAHRDFNSRQRAARASDVLTGRRRASQDLAYEGEL